MARLDPNQRRHKPADLQSAAELSQTLANTESPSGTPDVLAPRLRKDTNLQAIIDAWATLPEDVRRGILAMVEAIEVDKS